MLDKLPDEPEEDQRKVKHFSEVQNRPIYFPDIAYLKNKIMMNIEVPAYWYLDKNDKLSPEEEAHLERLRNNIVYLQTDPQDYVVDRWGQKKSNLSIFQVSEIFSRFGDT